MCERHCDHLPFLGNKVKAGQNDAITDSKEKIGHYPIWVYNDVLNSIIGVDV
jgi:hypothetical protein